MRDLGMLVILPFILYTSFKRPFIALGLWLWSSAISLNGLVYGMAGSIPFAKLFAGVTILSFFISKERSVLKIEALSFFIILFYISATISNFFCIGDPVLAWERWGVFSKILLFYFFAVAIVNKKNHFDLLAWILIISIGALSSKEGVKFLISGGSHRIGYLAGITGDNNFFGVMIVTVIPLACYIFTQTHHKILKVGVLAVILFMILGIFSTFSRGAFLGLAVFAITFWKSSDKKILWLIALIVIVFSLNNLMPETWLSRMDTVESADQDSSFMGRVVAWKIATLIAIDNFWGGGFKAVENLLVWQYYGEQFYKLDFIVSPDAFPFFKATHSIYFQVLSNHGFIGLLLFLMMLLTAYIKALKTTSRAKKHDLDSWVIMLSKMLKLSLVTYCVSGAAVNVAYFDFLYAILAMIVALDRITKEMQQKTNSHKSPLN